MLSPKKTSAYLLIAVSRENRDSSIAMFEDQMAPMNPVKLES
jgi:hypothetical protein